MADFKPIPIYRTGVWVNKKITYNGKYYTIDDSDDYFLQQIHKIYEQKELVYAKQRSNRGTIKVIKK